MEKLQTRVAILGNPSVGKTCILERFTTSSFPKDTVPTIGTAFKSFTFPINEKLVELHIFDCAGNERFNTLLPIYLRGIDSVVLVYSVSDSNSQKDVLKRWYDFVKQHPIVRLYLVGNKSDLEEVRLSGFDGDFHNLYKLIPDLKQIHVFKTSAKTGTGIDELFSQIAEDCYLHNVDSLPLDIVGPPVNLEKVNLNKSYFCCY